LIPTITIKKDRFCLDCGVSINDRVNNSKRCFNCQRERTRISVNERVKKAYLKKRVQFPTDTIKCMECGKDIIRGEFRGKNKRCPECKSKFKYDWRDNTGILVAKTCCECNEIMIIDRKTTLGKYRNYCEVCRPLHYHRTKFGYKKPPAITCSKCGVERRPHHIVYVEGLPYCAKCSKGRLWILKKKESKKRIAYKEVTRKLKEIERNSRHCVDCGIPLGQLKPTDAKTFRCRPCQKIADKICIASNNKKRTGGIMGVKSVKVIRKKDGTPDWEKEHEAVKKLKKRTYNPYVGDYEHRNLPEGYDKTKPAVVDDE